MSASDRRAAARADFEEYVAARGAALLRTAYLLTCQREDAAELVQLALVKAWPRWAHSAESPEPYVRTILAREAIHRRRRRRWREVSTDEVPEGSAPGSDPTDRDVLRRALLRLSPRQRAVVVLRWFEDLTEQQTADALGLGLGSVKSSGREALSRLREELGEELGEEVLQDAPNPAGTSRRGSG